MIVNNKKKRCMTFFFFCSKLMNNQIDIETVSSIDDIWYINCWYIWFQKKKKSNKITFVLFLYDDKRAHLCHHHLFLLHTRRREEKVSFCRSRMHTNDNDRVYHLLFFSFSLLILKLIYFFLNDKNVHKIIIKKKENRLVN